MRYLALIFGWICLAIGVVGAFVPLLPSTIFFILAVGAFARSSPRMEAYLLNHPRYGPSLKDWREHRAISGKVKALAVGLMALSLLGSVALARPPFWVSASLGLVLLWVAVYIVTRPEPPDLTQQ